MFQKSSEEIGIWFQKEYSNRKRIFFKYERFETENPLLVFGYNAKQNHWKGCRLRRSGYRDYAAPGSCRSHRGMEGLCTGEENHI